MQKSVILYIREMAIIGGLETFIFKFCVIMKDYYDLTVLYDSVPQNQLDRLKQHVKCVKNDNQPMECDTLLMMRMVNPIPSNVRYKKVIRRLHNNKYDAIKEAPKDGDITVCVSEMVKESFGLKDAIVIRNLSYVTAKPTLLLMSATRFPMKDKGNGEERMMKLADMLNQAEIPFMWLNFSNEPMKNPPKNFYNMGCTLDVQNFMQKADYIVSLHDVDACSNQVLEALTLEVPLIVTPVPSVFELGVEDGVNAHVVPFDMNFDVHKLLDIPKFKFRYDNESIIEQWKKIL